MEEDESTSLRRVLLVFLFWRMQQSAEEWELFLWNAHHIFGVRGWQRVGKIFVELPGVGVVEWGWGLEAWGHTLHSIAKTQRKALSKDGISNKSTSRLRGNKRTTHGGIHKILTMLWSIVVQLLCQQSWWRRIGSLLVYHTLSMPSLQVEDFQSAIFALRSDLDDYVSTWRDCGCMNPQLLRSSSLRNLELDTSIQLQWCGILLFL